jgi:K+-transporting ATPase A subunit
VLAQISCSRGCRISPYSRVFKLLFRFHQLLIHLIVIKSVAEKKKKKKKKSGSCSEPYLNGVLVLVLVLVSCSNY